MGHSDLVCGIVFSENDEYVVTLGGGADNTILIWKII